MGTIAISPNFGRIPKYSSSVIQKFELFSVLAEDPRSHIYADLFSSYFFICYLAGLRPILGYYQDNRLIQLILITAILIFFAAKVTRSLKLTIFKKSEDYKQTQRHTKNLPYRQAHEHKKVKI